MKGDAMDKEVVWKALPYYQLRDRMKYPFLGGGAQHAGYWPSQEEQDILKAAVPAVDVLNPDWVRIGGMLRGMGIAPAPDLLAKEIIAALSVRFPAAPPPPPPSVDAPLSLLKGATKMQQKMLESLWSKPCQRIGEFIGAVWGDDGATEEALEKAIGRLGKHLLEESKPASVTIEGGLIVFEHRTK